MKIIVPVSRLWFSLRPRENGLILAKELFAVLDEADEDHHGRTDQADEKHGFQNMHAQFCEEHMQIVARFRGVRWRIRGRRRQSWGRS